MTNMLGKRIPHALLIFDNTCNWRRCDLRCYQLRLKPAVMLLFVVPCAVSPTEPETVTPSSSFCSAPTLRSHLSSPDDRVCPALTLVPVSPMFSFADWS